jgi:hypothetical protein
MINELHEIFNDLERFTYPFENRLNKIPNNGIYIVFEKNEKHNGFDRIVRIGTVRGENNLKKRLKEHFGNENKNRSIFRKNIGRAMLNKNNNPYLKIWELDTISKANKSKYSNLIDLNFEIQIEKEISSHIKTNFSFCVITVETKEKRLFWESKLIATLAFQIQPSTNWLGNFSTKDKIRRSGLWQIQSLKKPKLTLNEFEEFKKLVSTQKI